MLSAVILGTGNLARHLFGVFSKTENVDVVQVVGRNERRLVQYFDSTHISTDFDTVKDADVYIIAVSDRAIGDVSRFLKNKKGLVVHTSGATEMDAIQTENRGVFYPLQTFSEERSANFRSIPICIEARKKESLSILQELADSISDKVHKIDSEQRKKLHLAAVFVNNFTNHFYLIGEEICASAGLSFDLLKPLIRETAEKVQSMSPAKAQTGPARRNDTISMEKHLTLLKDQKQIELYTLCSKAIKEVYEKKL
ncbi:Rossmann-like and DUF2520 domain-containing protein [Flagellimonas nanhaiensis]|uniref:DUF2520 domain-containing protein n=1 Tax=Flagellimonas nanhaiensis TaxID=2292706 RepID=A0A371JVC6_9FLAO|nr:Rossmann-like and DUF2520 domain-containing protein [Allomuricauda nanhaiensis]RDY61769.1 DUF2520 domain-containing protein [Allomuricauda nanhaiensis]